MRIANRVFTERALSQVEVVAHLLGNPTEFMHNPTCSFLNVSLVYWHIFRRWNYLRRICGEGLSLKSARMIQYLWRSAEGEYLA